MRCWGWRCGILGCEGLGWGVAGWTMGGGGRKEEGGGLGAGERAFQREGGILRVRFRLMSGEEFGEEESVDAGGEHRSSG